jgi:hypothetical protein
MNLIGLPTTDLPKMLKVSKRQSLSMNAVSLLPAQCSKHSDLLVFQHLHNGTAWSPSQHYTGFPLSEPHH